MNKQEKKLTKKLSKIYIKSEDIAQYAWNELCEIIERNQDNIDVLEELYNIMPIGILRYRINQKITFLKDGLDNNL